LRGGSNPVLLTASDDQQYVVKFLNNFQGPNLLFNEALGSALFRRVGLSSPEWLPVYVSEDFIDQNPDCWMQTDSGSVRPTAGWCFGSKFLGLKNVSTYEILSGRSFSRIMNRKDFLTAWVLDVLCEHADNRQAIFVEDDTRCLEACFIDNGHLFGGPLGTTSPSFLMSRYLDPRIYPDVSEEDADDIQRKIQSADLATFAIDTAANLPDTWKTPTTNSRIERFSEGISNSVLLKNLISFILGSVEQAKKDHDRRLAQYAIEYKPVHLCPQIPEVAVRDRIDRWGGDFVGDQRRRGPEAVRPSYPQAAGF